MKKVTYILYVDDDIDDREFFSAAMNTINNSVQVEFAENGVVAMAKLNSSEFTTDAVFCDLHMPLMDGFQLLEKIKSLENYGLIPVVIYTSSNHDSYRSRAELLGAQNYILKQTRFDDICKELKNALFLITKN